jgi:methenyltetrahydromethanopterin cyclohydrolase
MVGEFMRNMESISNLKREEGIATSYPFKGLKLIDMGVQAPGSWSSGKALIETMINGLGEVNFGELNINGYALPSIDIYFDNPIKSRLPQSKEVDGRTVFFYENSQLAFTETNKIPSLTEMENIVAPLTNEENEMTLIVTRPTSLISAIRGCAMSVPNIIEKLLKSGMLEEEILWAWSTTSFPALADDITIFSNRVRAAFEYGTIASFWVRTDDDKIRQILQSIGLCGELRIHNLRTAKTFVHGSVNETKLREIYSL